LSALHVRCHVGPSYSHYPAHNLKLRRANNQPDAKNIKKVLRT
jgi:hypothetical protein